MNSYRLSSYSHTDDRAAVAAIYAAANRKGDGVLRDAVKAVATAEREPAIQDVREARRRAHSVMLMRNANASAGRREALAMSRKSKTRK